MSSSDLFARARKGGRLAAPFLALALAGCFQPLYGPLSASGDVAGEMQAIAIDPVPDRLGHYLVNELIFALNGTGSHVTPRYRLMIGVRENAQTPLIDTVTGYPSAATVVVTAEYKLIPVQGGDPILKGSATTFATYDRTSQRFANIRASRDAEIRDAKTLADQIRTQIAAALAARG
ncbi:LPS assembly lipoprotein LptE [Methylocapsa acidiphila]|uniref:LPS assembly lipoprotein LptE n=1 Tax=Methylocapsa acidiphila TaxID=133552 RepID=UPI0004124316|nr:LPS assembly lipoprotein LptE [Methylocapsa acidiphila]